MKFVVTGGAGFIGRWVTARLLQEGHQVLVVDNLGSGSEGNLVEFRDHPQFAGLIVGSVEDEGLMDGLLTSEVDGCIHLAGSINVQASLDNPIACLQNNVLGTFRVLEAARKQSIKVTLVSTCMVYAPASDRRVDEQHPIRSASPYAASKVAAEELALSYYHGYGLPVAVLRPFNTYGPFQRSDGEGGVVSVFLGRVLAGRPVQVFGTGEQTRDLLYVTDCAEFIVRAALSPAADGRILNAGTGRDVRIRDLALMVAGDAEQVTCAPHPHPQSEIARLVCDASQAAALLQWRPEVSLEDGIARTRAHMERTCGR